MRRTEKRQRRKKEKRAKKKHNPEICFLAETICVYNSRTIKPQKDDEKLGWGTYFEQLSQQLEENEDDKCKRNLEECLKTALFREDQYNLLLGIGNNHARYVKFHSRPHPLTNHDGKEWHIPDCNLYPPRDPTIRSSRHQPYQSQDGYACDYPEDNKGMLQDIQDEAAEGGSDNENAGGGDSTTSTETGEENGHESEGGSSDA